jgi:hypothetical protein
VLAVARQTPLGEEPFRHLYLEKVLPPPRQHQHPSSMLCICGPCSATPLKQFGASPQAIAQARAATRVNAPEGRVLIE